MGSNVSKDLFKAAERGCSEEVERCIKNRGDINYTYNGTTALQIASEKGYLDCTTILLEHEANTDKQDRYQQTALHLAASAGKSKIVEKLIEADANQDIEDCHNQTPIEVAIENKHQEVVRAFINSAPLDAQKFQRYYALAKRRGRKAIARDLEQALSNNRR